MDAANNTNRVDFVFSNLRVVASLPTVQTMLEFSKKLQPPQTNEKVVSHKLSHTP